MRVTQREHPFLKKLSDHSALEVVYGADFDDMSAPVSKDE